MSSSPPSLRRYVALALVVLGPSLAAQTQAPADYGPVSVDLADVPYPYPVATFSFVLYGQDVRMAYMDVKPTGSANGQTVVLLHGFNFSGEAWRGTIDVLTREGFRVIVPDQIGFGRSSKPLIPYTFNDMAINTRRLLQSLGVDRAAIVGHSMGGMLASRFAMAYPDRHDARRDGESDRTHRRATGPRAALSRRRVPHRYRASRTGARVRSRSPATSRATS